MAKNDVSAVTNALESIRDAAENAKKAIDDMRNTPTVPSGGNLQYRLKVKKCRKIGICRHMQSYGKYGP